MAAGLAAGSPSWAASFPANDLADARLLHPAATSADCPVSSDPSDTQKARSHKWWSSDEGRAEFGLTEAQSRDLEAIFQHMLPDLKANKAEVDNTSNS